MLVEAEVDTVFIVVPEAVDEGVSVVFAVTNLIYCICGKSHKSLYYPIKKNNKENGDITFILFFFF